MKKLVFLPILFLLGLLSLSAQPAGNQVTVTGHVSSSTDGAAIPDWLILINIFNDPNGNPLFTQTDANGNYSIVVSVPLGVNSIPVQTFDRCFGLEILQNAPIVNGGAVADFVICDSLPPFPDCYADIYYVPTGGLNEFSFQAMTNSLDSNLVFTWDFGDGTAGTGNPIVHQYAQTGFYNVTLTSSSPTGCVSRSTVSIYVHDGNVGPVDTITVSGYVTNISNGSAIEGWGVYTWSEPFFNEYFGITNSNGYYTFLATVPEGTTSIQVLSWDPCTNTEIAVNAPVVNGAAVGNFQICYDIPPPPGCSAFIRYEQTDALTFNFYGEIWSNDPSGMVTYTWDFGDGTTSTEANPSHTYAEDGIYTITLSVNDGNGCMAHACEVVFTFDGEHPVDTFYYGCQAMFFLDFNGWGNPVGGFDNTFNFIDVSFGAVQSWAWDFGDGASSTEQNPVHTYEEDGVYTVSLHITTLDGCESTVSMEVYVGNNPWNEWNCQAMFLPLPADSSGFFFVDISSAPTPIQSWTWDFGDGTSSTEQNPFHTYAQPGIYTVSLTIEADSCNSIFTIEFNTENPGFREGENPVLGLSSLVSKTEDAQPLFEAVQVSPNPATADVNIVFDSKKAQDYEINILELSGKSVARTQQKANTGANVARLNVADLVPGLYMVQLKAADRIQTLKFVKQ